MDVSGNKRINFSKEEEQLLVDLVETYKSIIENKQSNATTWKDKEKAWQAIEKEFNSNSGQNPRNAKQLKEKYLNMKKRAKQKFSDEKNCNKQTGGGPYISVDITDVDIAIKNMIGKQITGLNNNYDSDRTTQTTSMNALCTNAEHDYVTTIPDLEQDIEVITETDISEPGEVDPELTTSQNTEENSINNDWSKKSIKLLKKPVKEQLRQTGSNRYKRKKFVSIETSASPKKYVHLSQQLIEEKLQFVHLQKQKFLEEHLLKMEIMETSLKIKKKKLASLESGN